MGGGERTCWAIDGTENHLNLDIACWIHHGQISNSGVDAAPVAVEVVLVMYGIKIIDAL